MKKIFAVVLLLVMLTACGTNYDINGAYFSESGNKDFCVVIYDDMCMIEVISTNNAGETASVVIDGKVTKEADKVVITIDKDKEIIGNQFEFLYNERFETLTSTSDGTTLKKEKVKTESPWGSYQAVHKDKNVVIDFYNEKDCTLTVSPVENPEQYVSAKYNGTYKAKGNIISLKFEDTVIDEDLNKFIYESYADVIMNTADGHIFKKIEEN